MNKVAIVGLGGMGRLVYNALGTVPEEAQIVGVADPREEAFSQFHPRQGPWQGQFPESLREVPGSIRYSDLKTMVKETKPDLLWVATPTNNHHSAVIFAAQYGNVSEIICEQPMAVSLAQAKDMIDTCHANGTLLTTNHTRRYWPEHQKIRELILAGKIGRLRFIRISCGSGRMALLGDHFINWVLWMVDEKLDSVAGYFSGNVNEDTRGPQFLDYPGHIVMKFFNNVFAVISVDNVALPPFYEIEGERGRITITECFGKFDEWRVLTRPEEAQPNPISHYYGRLQQEPFLHSGEIDWDGMIVSKLRNASSSPVADGYKTLEATIAAHMSALNRNKPLLLPLGTPQALNYTLRNA